MNCKPDDLAVISTAHGSANMARYVGRIVRVIRHVMNARDEVSWEYEAPRLRLINGEEMECIPDVMLRPIRDPGDDARDETQDWLKVPSTDRTTESA